MPDDNEKVNDVTSWLIPTKWVPPRYHVSVIDRSRLIVALDSQTRHYLSLIVAPAGFGKTTLLSQWRQRLLSKNNKVAWLTLDETDGDINNLLCYIIFSLISAGVDLGRLEMLAEQGLSDTSPRSCLGLLLTKISECEQDIILILDDYHRVQTCEVDQFIDSLLDNMPDNFHLVINSRERPQFDLAKLRSMGQLLELKPDDLRFDMMEMKLVVGVDLSEEQCISLFKKTEGWPVVIQLAGQYIVSGENKDQVLKSFSGKSDYLAEYLSEQVLNKCSEEVQDFLIKTSVLERVCNGLAYAVSDIEDGFDKLEKTGNINALFVPLDEEKEWFRYHHLFSDFLKEILRQRYPEKISYIHQRASEWFESDNNLVYAVRHACHADNFDRAASLIEKAGGWELILYGGVGFLRNLLGYIPKEQFKNYPRLQIAQAYLFQKKGRIREARNYIELASTNPILKSSGFSDDLFAFIRDFEVVEILQKTYEDSYHENDIEILNQSIKRVDPEDNISHGVIYCALSLGMMAEGSFDKGLVYVQEGIRSMRHANSVLGLNYCYIHLGQLSFYQGNLRQAEAYFLEAQNMADENFGSDSGLKFIADISLMSLRDWRGEIDDELRQFEAALAHIEEFDGWFEIFICAYEMLLCRACQEKNILQIKKLKDRCLKVVDDRGIERLELFVACCELVIATMENNKNGAERILYQTQKLLDTGHWEKKPVFWRPFQYIGKASVQWYLSRQNFIDAGYILDDMEACCREVESKSFLLNVLVMRADLEYQKGNMPMASDFLFEAAALAWPENITRPFTENDNIVQLVSATHAVRTEKIVDRLALNFLQSCAAKSKKIRKISMSQQDFLSNREMEVLSELQGGLSNKEIARALEMTEHTVKFHLKNIFAKLEVDKRAKAIIVAQQKGLLG